MTFSAKQFRELNDAYKSMYVPATEEEVTQEEAPVEEVKEVEESAAGMMSGQQSAQGSSQQVARAQQRLKDLGRRIKQKYQEIVPPPQRSNEPTVRSGERTPQTGMSYVASRDKSGERYDKSGTPAPAKLDPGTRGSTMPSRPQFKGVGARSGSAAAPVKTPTPPPAPTSRPSGSSNNMTNMDRRRQARGSSYTPPTRPSGGTTSSTTSTRPVASVSSSSVQKAPPVPVLPPPQRPQASGSKLNTDQQAVNREYDRLRKSGDMKGAVAYGKRMAAAGASKSDFKMPKDTKKESYDLVLDYLLSGGHAETVEEAHYIMLRLDADHVQEIVESAS